MNGGFVAIEAGPTRSETDELTEALIVASTNVQHAYMIAKNAGDVEMMTELRQCGWRLASALGRVARFG